MARILNHYTMNRVVDLLEWTVGSKTGVFPDTIYEMKSNVRTIILNTTQSRL